MKHLYKKVAELESGLLKLLSGSLITPAAAASLIASLNKIAASGVVKSLSSGGGAPGSSTDNRLVETIQKAAMAAAAASSGGGAPPFAVALGRLANSMGGKKSIGGSLRQGSSRSGSSMAGLLMGMRTDSSQAEGPAGPAAGHGKQHMLAKVRATVIFCWEGGVTHRHICSQQDWHFVFGLYVVCRQPGQPPYSISSTLHQQTCPL
jgi:hypothetical protein